MGTGGWDRVQPAEVVAGAELLQAPVSIQRTAGLCPDHLGVAQCPWLCALEPSSGYGYRARWWAGELGLPSCLLLLVKALAVCSTPANLCLPFLPLSFPASPDFSSLTSCINPGPVFLRPEAPSPPRLRSCPYSCLVLCPVPAPCAAACPQQRRNVHLRSLGLAPKAT